MLESYSMDSQEIENLINDMGFDWEDVFNSYEEFYTAIEEQLKYNHNHCLIENKG